MQKAAADITAERRVLWVLQVMHLDQCNGGATLIAAATTAFEQFQFTRVAGYTDVYTIVNLGRAADTTCAAVYKYLSTAPCPSEYVDCWVQVRSTSLCDIC